jgi:hypothetical protein
MTHRPAVTLIEVLIAMFIMAIGMLALLVLFPLGAVSMAQALKDDRCASTASMAENVAIATNVRYDPNVTPSFAASPLVYVDPYGALQGMLPVGTGVLPNPIPRVSPSFVTSIQLADRWFSLPDDMTFMQNGIPNTTSGFIDRGRNYSYAYLLRQLQPSTLVQLYAVVYSGRPVLTPTLEPTYTAAGIAGANSITVSATGANPWPTTIKRGGWILDSGNGYFYRVTNLYEAGTATTVEVQTNLVLGVSQVTVMDNVAEVFDKGTSWRP